VRLIHGPLRGPAHLSPTEMTIRNDRTATGRRVFAVRVAASTPEKLAEIALERGHYFIGAGGQRQGAAGQLMDAIAEGKMKLLPGDG
jgi:hypothetical protein